MLWRVSEGNYYRAKFIYKLYIYAPAITDYDSIARVHLRHNGQWHIYQSANPSVNPCSSIAMLSVGQLGEHYLNWLIFSGLMHGRV